MMNGLREDTNKQMSPVLAFQRNINSTEGNAKGRLKPRLGMQVSVTTQEGN